MRELVQLSFGTASLVALIYALWPHITNKDVRFRRQAWVAMGAFLLLTLALYIWSPSTTLSTQLHQSDTIVVSGRNDRLFEVFYALAFDRAPSLKVRFVKGRGTLELVEQSPTGFKFKLRDVTYSPPEAAEVE